MASSAENMAPSPLSGEHARKFKGQPVISGQA
jgi:hypothetical protein